MDQHECGKGCPWDVYKSLWSYQDRRICVFGWVQAVKRCLCMATILCAGAILARKEWKKCQRKRKEKRKHVRIAAMQYIAEMEVMHVWKAKRGLNG